jgi:signal transduction histidine kinase
MLAVFSAPILMLGNDIKIETFGLIFGLALVGFVSSMFAFRFNRAFETSFTLRIKVLQLLSETTSQKNQAVRENLSRSHFFASVSHDLRQPMHSINIYAEVVNNLLSQLKDGEPTRALKKNIINLKDSANYLNSMFDSLLDLSRVDAGMLHPNIDHVIIVDSINRLIQEFKVISAEHGLKFDVSISVDLMKTSIPLDIGIFERILRNFLTNAVRYTPSGSICLKVCRHGDYLDAKVIDTGVGMTREFKHKLFDEFANKLEASKINMNQEGRLGYRIGLGLVISKRLADLINGRLIVNSKIGKGSFFTLRMPCNFEEKNLTTNGQKEDLRITKDVSNIRDKYIVVIDDDPSICLSTVALLEAWGAEATSASSKAEAIKLLGGRNDVPDLILCDYRLEKESGLEAIYAIWDEFNVEIPAIIITGDTSADHVKFFGNVDFRVIHKPVSPEHLKQTIANTLIA